MTLSNDLSRPPLAQSRRISRSNECPLLRLTADSGLRAREVRFVPTGDIASIQLLRQLERVMSLELLD
jgi:hypothetical protein